MPLAIAILPSPGFLTASPPSKQTTARQDQAGQSSTGNGTGDGSNAPDSVVETEPSRAAHRFLKKDSYTVRTSQQWNVDQVV
jgi:hypothetical protein